MEQKFIAIIEGAIKLFKKYGLRSISMDEIALSMGMSKKTLYQYVANKEDLIKKTLEFIIERNSINDFEDDKNLNAIDMLLQISHMVRVETVEMNPVVVFDLHKFYPTIYHDIFVKKRDIIFKQMCSNFERGIKEGIYRNDMDIDMFARLYVKNLMEIHDPEFINATFTKIFNAMFDIQIRAIVNDKGLAYYEQKLKPQAI